MNFSKAQGTIEYLVILAVIVVVGLVVVSLLVNSTAPASGISENISQLTALNLPLAITDSSLNPDGNLYLKFKNNTGETIIIQKAIINGQEQNLEPLNTSTLSINSEQGFLIPTNTTNCTTETTINITITYKSKETTLEKRQQLNLTIPCEDTKITTNKTDTTLSYGEPYCGDGIINTEEEVCDGGTTTCTTTQGYEGTQQCLPDCSGYGPCTSEDYCGDEKVNGPEVCDGDLDTTTCEDTTEGYAQTRECKEDCSGYNDCEPIESCGDGIINGNEECDGTNLGGETCNSFLSGDWVGNLTCTSSCDFNTSECEELDLTPPEITLENPANNDEVSNPLVDFQFNTNDASGTVSECSLIVGGQTVDTNTNITESTTQWFEYTLLNEDQNTWAISCKDDSDNTDQSETRNIKYTVPVLPWTPAELGVELTAWFDASDDTTITTSGSSVTQWNDKSGNNNNAVQNNIANQASYDEVGQQIVFDGDDIFKVENDPFIDLQDFAVVTVGNWGSSVSNQNMFASFSSAGLGNTDKGWSLRQRFGLTLTLRGSTNDLADSQTAIIGSDFIGIGYRIAPNVYVRENGTEKDAESSANLINYSTAINRSAIGGVYGNNDWASPGFYLSNNSSIKELIVVENMTHENIEKLEGYLAHKWGLEGNLPSEHPYKDEAPTI